MATLYISVFESAAEVAMGLPIQEMTVTVGVSSQQSAPVSGTGRKPRYVRMLSDVACFVTWGSNPVALNDGTDGRPIPAEMPEYWNIEAGHKIAAIQR